MLNVAVRKSFLPHIALGMAAAIAALSGCSSAPVVQPSELVDFKPSAELKILWQDRVGAAGKNIYFPSVSGDLVYAVGASGEVSAFERSSGKTRLQFEAVERVTGGVGAGLGLVMLGTGKGEVVALDAEGKMLWKTQLSSEVLAKPVAAEGIVVVRTVDGRIYGLEAATGKSRWLYQHRMPALSVRTHTGVAVERGAVIAGFPGGRLVALSLNNGNVGWEAVVALPRGTTELERVADITSLPVLDFPRVCAVAFQGRVACFDVQRGTAMWTRDVSSVTGLDVDARYLYVTDDRSAVLALDKTSGASVWRQDKLAGRIVSAPLAMGRHVVVGDLEGYVHLLAAEDGSFAARIDTDGSPINAPPIALGASSFLVQTRDGGVFAISIQ